jgi:predicted acetyltransferase
MLIKRLSMPELFLISPDVAYKDSFLAGLREFRAAGSHLNWSYDAIAADFDHYVRSLHQKEVHPAEGRVPESYFWLIVDSEYTGRVSVRHRLNDDLRKFGGHMGYEIRPSFQRRGYGKLIGRLGLEKARLLGLQRILVTCDDDNSASVKIIESLGGVLEDIIRLDDYPALVRRYWIAL